MTNTSTSPNTPLRVFAIASYTVVDHHIMTDDELVFFSPKEAIKVLLDSGKVCEGSIVEFRISPDNPTSCEVYSDNGTWLANLELTKYGWGIQLVARNNYSQNAWQDLYWG